MRTPVYAGALAAVIAVGSLWSNHASADAAIHCDLKYSLEGWSANYKRADGHGVVTCDNGKTVRVSIHAVGGGLTVGKYKITDGTGKFNEVSDTHQLWGSYAEGQAEAGAGNSAQAQVLTKGTSSLALSGTGQGVNIGISFGKFEITPSH